MGGGTTHRVRVGRHVGREKGVMVGLKGNEGEAYAAPATVASAVSRVVVRMVVRSLG